MVAHAISSNMALKYVLRTGPRIKCGTLGVRPSLLTGKGDMSIMNGLLPKINI
jgi:hypothetical protein